MSKQDQLKEPLLEKMATLPLQKVTEAATNNRGSTNILNDSVEQQGENQDEGDGSNPSQNNDEKPPKTEQDIIDQILDQIQDEKWKLRKKSCLYNLLLLLVISLVFLLFFLLFQYKQQLTPEQNLQHKQKEIHNETSKLVRLQPES